ncbi:hypothetical protein BCV63_01515 [Cylindrospermopsis raciborskii CS-508]|nr:hypothetical protein BCV63_01515 [Cylindrospermopsis raciborskii CS-508]
MNMVWSRNLRVFRPEKLNLEGTVVPTPQEAVRIEVDKGIAMVERERLKAIQAQQSVEQERLRALQAEQDAKQSKAELRELQDKVKTLGISID